MPLIRLPLIKAHAIVNGNLASDAEQYAAVKSILRTNLQEHNLKLQPVNINIIIHIYGKRKTSFFQYGTEPVRYPHEMASYTFFLGAYSAWPNLSAISAESLKA